MDIYLYNNNSEPQRITKSLKNEIKLSGTLRDGTSILNPVITIQADTITSNYFYIPKFSRYYYITEIIAVRHGYFEVHGSVDVLMSFKSDILNLSVVIDKQEKLSNKYINDGSFITENRTFTTTKTFDNGFNETGQFILITAGKIGGAS